MDAVKIMAILNQAEDSFPVDEWEVFGVKVWPIIRFQIGFYLKTFKVDLNEAPSVSRSKIEKSASIIKSLINELKIFLFDYNSNDNIKDNVDAVFVISAPTININEKWYDETHPYINDCHDLGKKTIVIQLNPINFFHIPRKVKSIL